MARATDGRLNAAVDLLRVGLEEAFLQTSESCAFNLRGVDLELSDEIADHEAAGTDFDAASVVRESIQRWRDLSVEAGGPPFRQTSENTPSLIKIYNLGAPLDVAGGPPFRQAPEILHP